MTKIGKPILLIFSLNIRDILVGLTYLTYIFYVLAAIALLFHSQLSIFPLIMPRAKDFI